MVRSTFIFDFIRFLRAARFPLPRGSGNRRALRDSAFGFIPSLTFRSLGNGVPPIPAATKRSLPQKCPFYKKIKRAIADKNGI